MVKRQKIKGKNEMKNEKGLAKFIEVCGKGVGKIYEPIHLVRMAKARAKSMEIIAEAARNTNDVPMKIKFKDDSFATELETKEVQALCERAMGRDLYFKMIKQRNIESVIGKSYTELEDEEMISEEPVEQDWILRFFSYAEEVSDEDMQALWASILAGEIKKPKSYSLRTLNTLRNLSKEEALTFNKLQPLILSRRSKRFVVSNLNTLEKYGVTYEDLLRLEECGLLCLQKSKINMNIPKNQTQIFLEYHKTLIGALSKSKQSEILELGVYFLTTAGVELSSFVDEKNDDYIFEIAEMLSKNDKIELTIFKVKENDNDQL